MDTLSRQYTAKFFSTEQDYVAFRKHWATIVNDKNVELTSSHHLLYLVLSGKDWRKGFTLPTNKNKLDNGYQPGITRAMETLFSKYREPGLLAPFGKLVTHEALVEARKLVNTLGGEAYLNIPVTAEVKA